MVDIQSATSENMGRKKEDRRQIDRRRNHRTKISWPAVFHRVAIINIIIIIIFIRESYFQSRVKLKSLKL